MHLVVPFAAGLSEAAVQALQTLHPVHLERLLPRLQPGARIGGDEYALNLPYEHLLAVLAGHAADDGRLPLAALAARADGLEVPAGSGWGLLQPSHWQVGREQIVLRDPADLALDDAESCALFDAALPLFASEGWSLHRLSALRWYASHPSLAQLATASLDRVVGRNLDLWLPDRLAGRQVRRLQSEVQMLWRDHPVNVARETRAALPVNSFWLWGTGAAPAAAPPALDRPVIDERLRAPWRAEDWAGWAEAWQALDADVIAGLARRAAAGETVSLTLAGERRACRFDSHARPGWRRWLAGLRRASAPDWLAAL
jgi:hypothetical protein